MKENAKDGRAYEVLPFVSERSHGESRWRVVEKETGKVLDDAHGWGYKSKRNAHIGWRLANRSREEVEAENNRRRAVREWLVLQEELLMAFDEGSLYAAREGMDFDASSVGALLKALEIETEFNPREIFNAWKYGIPERDMMEPTQEGEWSVVQEEDAEMAAAMAPWDWLKSHGEVMEAFAAAEAGRGEIPIEKAAALLRDNGAECPFSAEVVLTAYLRGTPRKRFD